MVREMDIQLDDNTRARLSAIAVRRQTSPEAIAAELLRQVSLAHVDQEEDMAKLESMKLDGGVPHDEMMAWLKDLAAGKNTL